MKKVLGLFFLFLLTFSPLKAYEYNLSICMIFQNDAPYLKEWIEFHRLQGVDHFYLFNNLSTDNYQEILDPYIKEKVVTLFDWPHQSSNVQEWDQIQVWAYNAGFNVAKYQQNG